MLCSLVNFFTPALANIGNFELYFLNFCVLIVKKNLQFKGPFVNCHFSIILTVSICTEQNLIFFLKFICLIFFQLGNLFDFGSCTPFFLFFPTLVIENFLKTFSGCCLGISKALLGPKQYGSGEE